MRTVEYLASALGVLGSIVLAIQIVPHSVEVTWAIWTVGNALFCLWGWRRRAWGVLGMNAVFICLDVIGFVNTAGLLK